ncbi:MAG TPA: (2Fe-2S) ferredoxin domain-containing protein, partial [Phycisphaerales bacterium]|nr:(2Fe-2S) ferredoxin domain-containing protein [Phycisphaerales bacterium]
MTDKKINSLQDIEQLREQLLSGHKDSKARVLICMTGCRALGAGSVAAKFRENLKSLSLETQVAVVETGCIGICAAAPVVLIEPYEYLYGGVKP